MCLSSILPFDDLPFLREEETCQFPDGSLQGRKDQSRINRTHIRKLKKRSDELSITTNHLHRTRHNRVPLNEINFARWSEEALDLGISTLFHFLSPLERDI